MSRVTPGIRSRIFPILVLAGLGAACVPSGIARAQTCMGYPSFATSPTNVSADGIVGGRFWGADVSGNLGRASGGLFGDVRVGTTNYIDDPKETRFAFSGSIGYEKHSGDQLIWCPVATVGTEQGNTINLPNGRHSRTYGTVLGGGVGVSGELAGRGRFSINPFFIAQFEHLATSVAGDSATAGPAGQNVTRTDEESGIAFSAGLGVRLRDAIQITPYFTGATFEGSDLSFALRISIAFEFRRR